MTERALDTLARRAGHAMLRQVTDGCLDVTENGRTTTFGSPSSDLRARVEILDPKAWPTLMRGSNGLRAGLHRPALDDRRSRRRRPRGRRAACARSTGCESAGIPCSAAREKLARLVPRNTKDGARHNISAHYDLGNDLFAAFLDERLMYSSAYYPSPDASLEDAQTEKLDRLCRQLKLEPDDHLIEIGTGWGGMAIYAASEYGCRVTTTTISKEQRAYAMRVGGRGGTRGSDHGPRSGLPRPRAGSTRSWSRSR